MSGPLPTAVLVLVALALLRGPSSAGRARRVAGAGTRARCAPPTSAWARRGSLWWSRRTGGDRPRLRSLAERWAAGLRAGRTVDGALDDALALDPVTARALPRLAGALRLHGDVAAALRADAATQLGHDAATLRALSACWSVGSGRGAGLATAVERVAGSVRADEQHRSHVRAELAGPRASARLLALLPLLVLGMGTTLGLVGVEEVAGDPWCVAAVVAGLVLDAVGLWWTAAIARDAERTA